MVPAAAQPATLSSAFRMAWPASLAAIITPLLGLTDVAVLARTADAEALAGASLAGAVFSLLYWSFSFLRTSLSGLVAQSLGAGDEEGLRARLAQGALLGLLVGCVLLALAGPIGNLSRLFLVEGSQTSPAAGEAMQSYIEVRILAAPAVITTTAFLGWFTGQGRTGLLMLTTIGAALVNAGLSILFVLVLDKGIVGLAAATAIAEVIGLVLAATGAGFVMIQRGGLLRYWRKERLTRDLRPLLSLNRDIFIRTLILDSVFLGFARFGAGFGDLTLAANHVLLNLVLTITLLLDGPAIAAEAFVGQAIGADRHRGALFSAAWRQTAKIAAAMALIMVVVIVVFGKPILLFTIGDGPESAAVLGEALNLMPWAALTPVAVAVAYHLDGVYIGATRGAALRNTMALSALLFFGLAFALTPVAGNHALWAAFIVFMVARGLGLVLAWGGFRKLTAMPDAA